MPLSVGYGANDSVTPPCGTQSTLQRFLVVFCDWPWCDADKYRAKVKCKVPKHCKTPFLWHLSGGCAERNNLKSVTESLKGVLVRHGRVLCCVVQGTSGEESRSVTASYLILFSISSSSSTIRHKTYGHCHCTIEIIIE